MDHHEAKDGQQTAGSEAGAAREAAPHRRTRGWMPLAAAGAIALAGVALGSVALSRGGRPTVLLASQSGTLKPGATVTVTGSGTVTGQPDTLSFEIGVHSTASSALGGAAGERHPRRPPRVDARSPRGAGVRPADLPARHLR